MTHQGINEVRRNLENAIEAIENATGLRPKGFRAPAFSIPQSRQDIFSLLIDYFEYDSSLVLYRNNILSGDYKSTDIFLNNNFKEFPIVPKSRFNGYMNIKSGGTYLRVFSSNMIKEVLDYNISNNFVPLIYMHPYDYLFEKEFWVDYKYFKKLPFFQRINRYMRQNQWLNFGNKNTLSKVLTLLKDYKHIGRMGFDT